VQSAGSNPDHRASRGAGRDHRLAGRLLAARERGSSPGASSRSWSGRHEPDHRERRPDHPDFHGRLAGLRPGPRVRHLAPGPIAKDKPRIERTVQYGRESFCRGEEFSDLARAQASSRGRVSHDDRIHGATARRPVEDFTAWSRPADTVRPGPPELARLATTRHAHGQDRYRGSGLPAGTGTAAHRASANMAWCGTDPSKPS